MQKPKEEGTITVLKDFVMLVTDTCIEDMSIHPRDEGRHPDRMNFIWSGLGWLEKAVAREEFDLLWMGESLRYCFRPTMEGVSHANEIQILTVSELDWLEEHGFIRIQWEKRGYLDTKYPYLARKK